MVRIRYGNYSKPIQHVEIEYDSDNSNDEKIVDMIFALVDEQQDSCQNCEYLHTGATFCGYAPTECDLHGVKEDPNNPYHDVSICEDYKRRDGKNRSYHRKGEEDEYENREFD